MDAALDQPIYDALASRHAGFARGGAGVLRYPADIAPFLGVRDAQAAYDEALAALVPPGDTVYLLGTAPRVGADWSLRAYADLAQMVCDDVVDVPDGPAIAPLGEDDRADVLELTALVYPHYFRPRTMELGRYFGIRLDGRLAAIVGERLGTPEAQEISAVCTHPDFLGRGLARRLLAHLGNDVLAHGRRPYLHVSHENLRAKQLYERNGWRPRRDIGFWSLQRRA